MPRGVNIRDEFIRQTQGMFEKPKSTSQRARDYSEYAQARVRDDRGATNARQLAKTRTTPQRVITKPKSEILQTLGKSAKKEISKIGGLNVLDIHNSRAYDREWKQKMLDSSIAEATKLRNFNHEQALSSRRFSSQEAQAMRDFQKERQIWAFEQHKNLANTAFQRKVKDLKKAGINPMFAAWGQGSPMPTIMPAGGAQAHASNQAHGSMPSFNMPNTPIVQAGLIKTLLKLLGLA